MRNKTLPRIAKVFGFIIALALTHSSNAVQITMTLPDCPSGQSLTFAPATNTLSCGSGTPQVVVNTPSSCAITASPESTAASGLLAGTQVTTRSESTGQEKGGQEPKTRLCPCNGFCNDFSAT